MTHTGDASSPTRTYPAPAASAREADESRLRTISEGLDLDRYLQASEVRLEDARSYLSQLLTDSCIEPSSNSLPAYQPYRPHQSDSRAPVAAVHSFSQPSAPASFTPPKSYPPPNLPPSPIQPPRNPSYLCRLLPVAFKRDTSYSDALHPTFSSWIKNMNALSALINRLSELAATAPHEYRPRLKRQVAALRAGFKKQQERCIAFLQLTNEYADRFLLDISEEIQQQSSFLDALEKRLDMAKTLRQEAIHMRKSYEDGTLDCIKKVRRTGVYRYMPSL
jgi:hypothetical protein